MILTLLLLACEPVKVLIEDSGATETSSESGDPADSSVDPGPLLQDLSVEGPPGFDPVLGGPITFTVIGAEQSLILAEVYDAAGTLQTTLADGTGTASTLSWDGKDSAGALSVPGAMTLHIHGTREGYEDIDIDQPFWLVRLGVLEGTLAGTERVGLIWHSDGGSGRYFVSETTDPTFTLSALVDADGVAVRVPEPWEDLDSPPDALVDQNMPAAYPYDATPALLLKLGAEVGNAGVTASIEGWTTSDDRVTDGGTLSFVRGSALAEGPRVVEETLSLSYALDGVTLATQEIPLRYYATLGPPTFDESDSPYLPWVAVIDPALRDIAGVAPTEEAVISGLVDYIYSDLGLSYDTRYGASAYMSYRGWSWDSADFNMSAFLERSNGDVVNCSDCAGILSVHANMLGAYLGQSIISPSFSLNYILAIGGDEFTHCPFGPGSCGFSYHAVTSPDDSAIIYDATLALDGDSDPGATPNEILMVQTITGDEYLERLVMSGSPRYSSYGTGSIR